MTPAICCYGRTCPECRRWATFVNEFRKWIDGKYKRRRK